MELNIDNFYPGPQAAYAYKARGDEVIGAGPIKPLVLHVALFGNRVGPSMRITDPKLGTGPIAQSANFLDIEDPVFFELTKGDDSESINIEVTAEEVGLYQISFTFYSVLGEVKQQRTEPPIWIYYEGI